jgi:hypothetical protein
MRQISKSALLLLFFIPHLAFSAYFAQPAYLAASRIAGNQTFTYLNFTPDNVSAYYLVSMGGEEKFLVWVHPVLPMEGLFVAAEPVLEESHAASILAQMYSSNGADISALLQLGQTHALVQKFSASRKSDERKCDIYLGLDEHNCTDFDSCQKACYSRTSFCQPLALGIGRPLIGAIMNYSDGKRNITSLLETEEVIYALLMANQSAGNFDAYWQAVLAIDANAGKINSNPLFTAYQLCYPINASALSAAKQLLASMRAKAYPLLAVKTRARDYTEFARARWNNSLPIIVQGEIPGRAGASNFSLIPLARQAGGAAFIANMIGPFDESSLQLAAALAALSGVGIGIAMAVAYAIVRHSPRSGGASRSARQKPSSAKPDGAP